MEVLNVQPTTSTPAIRSDLSAGILELSGESYPENSFEFYTPVLSWLQEYLEESESLQLDIKVIYMNSSSIKCMLDMLDMLGNAAARGKEIVINWYYDRENSRALDLAEDFREDVKLPFNIIPVEG
ncbi:biofilm regulation phosphoprotein SiaC [Desulforhabdus amnigena]|jgi:hypothetical protein|uniref:SiaC family regulatory phosphoprotein domain-containing protein n=1 Tax=Desulforhabdus amnigena TaxID=40218 RepID=A0A9W6FR35_9BACT|nr:biofilm regulation phosphoprotein SiaC [Desulforhabdus amnigena]NLJ28845.1 DUF1987 domain-containing protein [Deltaproteobacteria bacterium]GLI33137.1 hypothetical protein DAMNIGENAA_05700 [Desulforhabdus amnigena]